MSINDRWSKWLEESPGNLGCLPFKFVDRQVRSSLAIEGFNVPSRRALKETLEHGLQPIVRLEGPNGTSGTRPFEVSLAHLLNMFWQPLLR